MHCGASSPAKSDEIPPTAENKKREKRTKSRKEFALAPLVKRPQNGLRPAVAAAGGAQLHLIGGPRTIMSAIRLLPGAGHCSAGAGCISTAARAQSTAAHLDQRERFSRSNDAERADIPPLSSVLCDPIGPFEPASGIIRRLCVGLALGRTPPSAREPKQQVAQRECASAQVPEAHTGGRRSL